MKRTLAEFEPLWPAEQKLRQQVHTGLDVIISDSVPPDDAPHDLKIRASFLRYLAIGGCDACRPSEKGLRVRGAYIDGDGDPRAETKGLDLEGCTLHGDLALVACRIPDMLLLRSTSLRNLYLNESDLAAGLSADRLAAKGGVFLRGVTSTGETRLLGADLGGDLDCIGARLKAGKSGYALSADRLTAKGGVFLRGVTSTGAIRLLGADLGGNLDSMGATLTAGKSGHALSADRLTAKGGVLLSGVTSSGAIRLLGADLGGTLDCVSATLNSGKSGDALNADGLTAKGALFLRKGASIKGRVKLNGATVGSLNDDPACWPKEKGDLLLDQFRYSNFAGPSAPVNAKDRLAWLALQDPGRLGLDFWPQPYEQLAKVFRQMGHLEDAREVLIVKERLQREAARGRARWYWRPWLAVRDAALDLLVAFGRRPLRAAWWLAGVWLIGLGFFAAAHDSGAIKPNSAVVLRSPEWVACDPQYISPPGGPAVRWRASHTSQLDCFLKQPEAAAYPAFHAGIYSADTLLPIVSLEMQDYWIPDERNSLARGYLWLHIALGWGLSLLAVAGFSGLIKSD